MAKAVGKNEDERISSSFSREDTKIVHDDRNPQAIRQENFEFEGTGCTAVSFASLALERAYPPLGTAFLVNPPIEMASDVSVASFA